MDKLTIEVNCDGGGGSGKEAEELSNESALRNSGLFDWPFESFVVTPFV